MAVLGKKNMINIDNLIKINFSRGDSLIENNLIQNKMVKTLPNYPLLKVLKKVKRTQMKIAPNDENKRNFKILSKITRKALLCDKKINSRNI